MLMRAMAVGDHMLVKSGEMAPCDELVAGGAAF